MHKEYKGLGATFGPGVACETDANPPVAEVLMHIDVEIDRLFNTLENVCNRVSCVCSNNPMHIQVIGNEQAGGGAKEHQQPSEVLVNLREKLARIERASNILSDLQRQLQI